MLGVELLLFDAFTGERKRRGEERERGDEGQGALHRARLTTEVEGERDAELERVGERVQHDDRERESRIGGGEREDDNHHRDRSKRHAEAHHA